MNILYGKKSWLVLFFLNISGVTCFISYNNTGKANRGSNQSSDVFLNSVQLLQKYNYPTEEHVIITKDGYKLRSFRIPRKGPPVMLVHGIGDTSDCWLVLGPKHSLAYLLADAGFDVWLFNARGNRYSNENPRRISQKQYWDFSYEEIGILDLPATIDHILNITRRPKLTYIGFSQGTTVFFVMCSMLAEYNSLIDHAILLAPVAWIKHIKFPLINFFSRNLENLTLYAENKKVYEVFPYNYKFSKFHATVCRVNSPLRLLCELEYYIQFGVKKLTNLLTDRLPVITSHIPAGSSAKVFFHFIQGHARKRFQRYDYGIEKNKKVYASLSPPEYNVSLISVPMTLVVSEIDWFCDKDDVDTLKSKLKTVDKVINIKESVQFTHLEFVYGSRVNTVINEPVINILENLRNK
ncbi:lipase 1-like [Vanessa cardui]|uniref:lipase 1-like n=1 Tax=Vanessa cardui TaxID=171605 RepID=UPI001F1412D0|nr:lipase 1-like [Vanessa cardui]